MFKKFPKERKEVINLKCEILEKTVLFCYHTRNFLPPEIKEIIIKDFQDTTRKRITNINKKIHAKKFRFCMSQIRNNVAKIHNNDKLWFPIKRNYKGYWQRYVRHGLNTKVWSDIKTNLCKDYDKTIRERLAFHQKYKELLY